MLTDFDIFLTLAVHLDDPKSKLQDVVKKLAKKHLRQRNFRSAALQEILNSKSPREDILRILRRSDRFSDDMFEAAQKFTEEGYQGLVLIRSNASIPPEHWMTVLPVEVLVETREDYLWGKENEDAIRCAAAQGAMNVLNLNYIDCMVHMFRAKGFTGEIDEWTATREGLTKATREHEQLMRMVGQEAQEMLEKKRDREERDSVHR